MDKTDKLVRRAARALEASPTTSPTAAGQASAERGPSEAHIDAINQVFALFRLNYHNQFYAAWPDASQLNQVKKLWLEALAEFPVSQILVGARHAIESSEYLPTLHRMLDSCQQSLHRLGLPAPRDAYREACGAASPRSAQAWSHPAVYLAGRDSDWFFLANTPEAQAFPVFMEHYQQWCNRVMAGETLEIPAPAALEKNDAVPSSREQALAELAKIRGDLAAD
jgi:hypothetical protein